MVEESGSSAPGSQRATGFEGESGNYRRGLLLPCGKCTVVHQAIQIGLLAEFALDMHLCR